MNSHYVKQLFNRFGYPIDEAEAQELIADKYSEPFFKKLGASVIDSMDVSTYEGATIIQDLNKPLQPDLVGKYTCVIEFGTLEHVFNFPEGLKSTTGLLEVGGTLISITPCSNMMGHGFYQFSPELYFNYLSKNGFAAIEIYLFPWRWFEKLFRVSNPHDVGGRVELVSPEIWQMGIIAIKIEHKDEVVVPIQSDYQALFWHGNDIDRRSVASGVDPALAKAIAELQKQISALARWPESLSEDFVVGLENKRYFRLMDPAVD